VWLGRVAGWRPTRTRDGAMLGLSAVSPLFPPWLAFLLAYGTAELLGFGVFTRLRAFDQQLWRTSDTTPSAVAWILLGGIAAAMLIWVAGSWAVRRASRRSDVRGPAGLILVLVGAAVGIWMAVSLAGRAELADLVGLMILPAVAVALINLADTT